MHVENSKRNADIPHSASDSKILLLPNFFALLPNFFALLPNFFALLLPPSIGCWQTDSLIVLGCFSCAATTWVVEVSGKSKTWSHGTGFINFKEREGNRNNIQKYYFHNGKWATIEYTCKMIHNIYIQLFLPTLHRSIINLSTEKNKKE